MKNTGERLEALQKYLNNMSDEDFHKGAEAFKLAVMAEYVKYEPAPHFPTVESFNAFIEKRD